MLASNIIILKQKLNQLLATPPVSEGVVYKAAYDAYYEVAKFDTTVKNNDPDLGPIVSTGVIGCEKTLKDNAKKFATIFCKGLKDGGFMDTIADEVDAHIKSSKLVISMMPQGIATIVSPMGPCTGSMIISDETANIQIL